MYLLASFISVKHSTWSTTGNCFYTLEDGSDVCFVSLQAYWYSNQMICVAWQGCYSDKFMIGNGTKQGRILSPYLFTRNVRQLLIALSQSRLGCNIGKIMLNVLAYADDMVLLAPSWHALQELIKILEYCCTSLDTVCNTKKNGLYDFQT